MHQMTTILLIGMIYHSEVQVHWTYCHQPESLKGQDVVLAV